MEILDEQPPEGPVADEPGASAAPQAGSGGEIKRPQSVLVAVCNRQGEFLLLERTRPKGFWQSVTGSLAPGETPRSAAAREVREETGILAGGRLIDLGHSVLFPIIPAWRGRYAPNVCFNREYWLALVLDARRHVRLSDREHLGFRWLPAAEAVELTGSWTNREAIQRVAFLLDPSGGCGLLSQGGRSIRRSTRVIDPRFRRALSAG